MTSVYYKCNKCGRVNESKLDCKCSSELADIYSHKDYLLTKINEARSRVAEAKNAYLKAIQELEDYRE